jgi:hypothetical protein
MSRAPAPVDAERHIRRDAVARQRSQELKPQLFNGANIQQDLINVLLCLEQMIRHMCMLFPSVKTIVLPLHAAIVEKASKAASGPRPVSVDK